MNGQQQQVAEMRAAHALAASVLVTLLALFLIGTGLMPEVAVWLLGAGAVAFTGVTAVWGSR